MHVCTQLSQPNEQGIQTCLQWEAQTIFGLPQLTAQEASQIGFYIVLVCTAAFCYKLLALLIKTFIK